MINRPLNLLNLTRVFMFCLLGSIYYLICKDGDLGRKVFVITATILFVGSHMLYHSPQLKIYQPWFISLDLLLSACFGFLFAGETNLYSIMFGIIAVTLFIMTDKRRFLYPFICTFFLLWMAIFYDTYRKTNQIQFTENLVMFMFIIFCAVVGGLIHKLLAARETIAAQFEQLSISHHQLSEVHEQIMSYSKQVEELTVIRERNQIAREIHDTFGHKVTALIVQLQLASEFIRHNQEKCKEAIQNGEALAREALEDIRTSVRTLHEDDEINTTFISTLQNLLKGFSDMTKIDISLEICGDPSIVPTTVRPVITRIIQESLTNSKRHGNATKCHISIHCKLDFIQLSVIDNGKGAVQLNQGFGLLNMRERVTEHGGTIQFESLDGHGFHVKVELPLKKFSWSTGGEYD